MRPVRIRQHPKTLQRCRDLERQVLANKNIKPGQNYTGKERPERFYIGYRGEFAVVDWLSANCLRPDHRICTDGSSQEPEIIMPATGQATRPTKVEVKCAGQPYHRKMMFPAEQKMDFDIIIATKADTAHDITIWGWLHRQECDNYLETGIVVDKNGEECLSCYCDLRVREENGPLRRLDHLLRYYGALEVAS